MFSTTKCMSAVVLASALLLFTSPLAAALRSKPSSHSAAHISATHNSPKFRASTRTASHRPDVTAGSRKAQGRVLAVRSSKPRFHGQQSIDQERTLEIQQALIREHYLDGEASGEWDQATRDALIRFQSDNHWQTKVLPDARALIKLGLGPSQQNLLNPESAAIAMPYQSGIDRSAHADAN